MATKSFHLGDILTVSTGTLVSSMDGVYHILNHMTQADLYTHQILLASPIMREELLRQLPFLNNIDKPIGLSTREGCDGWVSSWASVHGEHHNIESAEHLWQGHSALSDLEAVMREAKNRG